MRRLTTIKVCRVTTTLLTVTGRQQKQGYSEELIHYDFPEGDTINVMTKSISGTLRRFHPQDTSCVNKQEHVCNNWSLS